MGTKLLLAANAPLKELDTQIDSNDSSYFFHMSKRSKSLINHSQRFLFELSHDAYFGFKLSITA